MHEDMKSLSRRIASLLSSNPNLKLRDIARFIGANRHNIEHAVKTQYGFRFQELKKMARLRWTVFITCVFICGKHALIPLKAHVGSNS
jgi:hypothetical protein